MRAIEITFKAENDMLDIWDYSKFQWGVDQADKYITDLESCFEKMARGIAHTRDFPIANRNLKQHHCQSHMIFFIETDKEIIVQRILGDRMKFIKHLRNRL
jgi:toxin ParE1/3/4